MKNLKDMRILVFLLLLVCPLVINAQTVDSSAKAISSDSKTPKAANHIVYTSILQIGKPSPPLNHKRFRVLSGNSPIAGAEVSVEGSDSLFYTDSGGWIPSLYWPEEGQEGIVEIRKKGYILKRTRYKSITSEIHLDKKL